MSEPKTLPRHIKPVEDHAQADRLLQEGVKTFASAMVWTKNQEHVFSSHLNFCDKEERLICAWVPKNFDAGKFEESLLKSGSQDCYFSLSLSSASVFFKAKFEGFDTNGLKFRRPGTVFKVQRRKDVRMPILDGYTVRVSFQDPVFAENTLQKKAVDISASGLSFLIQDHEQTFFTVGMVLKNFTFDIRERTIVTEAEIRHIKRMPPDSRHRGVKVGVAFMDIRPGDSQAIAAYVFDESRKYFSKII